MGADNTFGETNFNPDMTMKTAEEAIREFGEALYDGCFKGIEEKREDFIRVNTTDLNALISEHYYPKEFTTWLVFGSHPFCEWFDDDGWYFTDELSDKRWSIDELYDYWLKNVKK